MARKPRIHYPGACYHVILRGNSGSDIFFVDQDRHRFLFLLQRGLEKFHHRIHAYCLMSNHVHLVIQVREIPLSRIVHNVSFRYARYLNYRKNRTGHIFQGRYKAVLIDVESYLFELVRYVHNNPVRANMVKSPDLYRWSSHAAYLGKRSSPLLSTDWILSQFSLNRAEAIKLFQKFVSECLENVPQDILQIRSAKEHDLKSDQFAEEDYAKDPQRARVKLSLEQVIETVCDNYEISPDNLRSKCRQRRLSEARAVVSLLARETENLSLTALGKELNRDISSLSQAAGRLDRKLKDDARLAIKLTQIREDLKNWGQA